MEKTYSTKAYAKVNLALDVLRKREDGYHDVRMIMQNLDIYDELDFSVVGNDGKITIEANRADIPTDERNLVYKAIKLICDEYNINPSIHVKLTKNIPVEAGMAGGSTDGAAALKAINHMFSLGASQKRLMELGVRLGADVPYCVLGQTALSEGIGEILTPIDCRLDCVVVVAKPKVNVSTGMIYNKMQLDKLLQRPDIDGMLEALLKNDVNGVASRMLNVMESVTAVMYKEIEDLKQAMKDEGALNAIMSGSGPTVFGLFTDKDRAQRAAEYIREGKLANEIFVTKPV